MSQDPQSGYNPNPEKPYTDPSAYEIPSSPPTGVPPLPNSSQDPPSTYYGEYQQPPYDMPPPGANGSAGYNPNNYGYDPNRGGYGYNPNQAGYGYGASSPLPLGEAISQLPNQYITVLTKPSPFTLAAEMGKASWDILWVQLIAYAIIAGILAYVQSLIPWMKMPPNAPTGNSASVYEFSQLLEIFSSYGLFFIIPSGFFIGQGITYLVAKAFGGTGTFLKQGYTSLLITVPLGIVSSVLAFVPVLGTLASLGLVIYSIVLQIFSLMAVHRLSGGKASAVFLLPVAILFVLLIIIVAFIVVIAVVVQTIASSY